MRRFFTALVLGLLVSAFACAQSPTCEKGATFGSQTICLPELVGYEECYAVPIVKQTADASEVAVNEVLGFYLNDSTYARVDELATFVFDDYAKVYGTKQLMNLEVDASMLPAIKEQVAASFQPGNWEEVKKQIDETGLGVAVGVPVLVKDYRLNDRSFTYVAVIKYSGEEAGDFTMGMTINGLLLQDRMVWMAYYLRYEGDSTIERLEEQTKVIVERMLAVN